MKIRMLLTKRGSPDGITVLEYEAGRKYDIPAPLATIFLAQGWAEEDKELTLETKNRLQPIQENFAQTIEHRHSKSKRKKRL